MGRRYLKLGLRRQRGRSAPVPAITGITLSNSTVDDNAAVGDLVGHLFMVGGTEPATFTFTTNPSSLWQIDGNRLEVAADISSLGGTEEEPVIKVTDALGQEFSVLLPITIGETVAEPENPLPDDGTGVDDTGDFDIIPVVQPTSGGTKITGKNSGVAAFLYDVGPPVVGTYTMQVTNDYSGMSKGGRAAAVGFGFQDGTDFHLVSSRGDGANPADMLNSQLYGNFTQPNQFTITNDGAATNGTKDGPNWQQIEILEGGGYTYRTGTGADVDNVTWTDEFTDELPPPLASTLDALKFGPSAYYAGNDRGVASHLFSWWEALSNTNWDDVSFQAQFIAANGTALFEDESKYSHSLAAIGDAQVQSNKLELDGTGDYLSSLASHASVPLSGDFTIEVFGVTLDTVASSMDILASWSTGQASWILGYRGDLSPKRFRLMMSTVNTGAGATEHQFNHTLTAGVAVDLCMERSGSTLRCYVDGVMIGSTTTSADTYVGTSPLTIGAHASGAGPLNGRLAAIRRTAVALYANDAGYVVPTLPLVAHPVNVVAPLTSGTVGLGNTMTCTTGTWTGNPTPTFTYQWRSDAVNISGATSSSFVITASEVGTAVDCIVTATNTGASVAATSAHVWDSVVLQIQPTAADGTTSFTDEKNGRTITVGGDAEVHNNEIHLSGTGYLSLAHHADWDLTGDFCVDFVNVTFDAVSQLGNFLSHVAGSTGGYQFLIQTSASVLDHNHWAGPQKCTASGFVPADTSTVYQIRWERRGSIERVWINGVLRGISAMTNVGTVTGVLQIGRSLTAQYLNAHIGAVRFTKHARLGTSRAYTPVARPLPTS